MANWIRLGIVVLLAGPSLLIGTWALLDPEGWFTTFPGVGPDLVAGEKPFNRHLAFDAGAGFFATGTALALAASWAGRRVIQLALVAFLAFSVPHLGYHALNPAPDLSAAADWANALMLGSNVLWALGLLWAASTDRFVAAESQSNATGTPVARPEEVSV